MSSNRRRASSNLEICIGGISYQTEPHALLAYFEQYGSIEHYTFTSPDGGGFVFITYNEPKSVDRCMASRPHRLDGQHLYVKRALHYSSERPREHIDSSRDIMIIRDSMMNEDEQFLKDLREYFSSYGTLYACKYCHEANFDYILVEFADYDQVDRIILDKPHYFNGQLLNVMKCISSNKLLMNRKYSPKDSSSLTQDSISIDSDYKLFNVKNKKSNESFGEIEAEAEVYRLQNVLKQITEDFNIQRDQLEQNYCEQLKKLNQNAGKTHQLQQDLEQECAKLQVEYESLKRENNDLNEQYIMAELENFELTSYYEQVLAEEKAKTAQYEAEYTEKLQLLYVNDCLLTSSSPQTSTSPSLPAIPDDDDYE